MNRIEFYMKLDKYKAEQKAIEEEKKKGEVLMHYGTIGQKWGVRKWQNADGTFNEAGKERYFGKSNKTSAGEEKVGSNYYNNNNMAEMALIAYLAKKDVDLKNELRSSYYKIMKDNPDSYSKEDRMAVLHNKKKIDKMEDALNEGKTEKYEKLLNKVKDEDKETVKRFVSDLMKARMKQSNPETEKALEKTLEDNKLGSISKPKVPKKFLNEDGTLNEKGKLRVDSKRSTSDIASSVFNALKYINIASAAVMGPAIFATTLTGFGVPLALAMSLGYTAVGAGAAGVDQALYKKLEKRADAYYEMING